MTRKLLFHFSSYCLIQVLFLCSAISASSIQSERQVESRAQIEVRNANRNVLVPQLYSLENLLTTAIAYGDKGQISFLLDNLNSIGSQILDESERIYSYCLHNDCFNEETKYENDLQIQIDEQTRRISRLLFLAKLRNCESPTETYFEPMNQCVPIDSARYCPDNMILKDGPQNKGFCECVDSSKFLVSAKTGQCYKQNTQGPCQNGKWLIVRGNNLVCQPIPEGCPADGQHVFWSPDAKLAKMCWKMGTKGPCPADQILIGNGGLDVSCGQLPTSVAASIAPLRAKNRCKPGSFLNQQLKCVPSFFSQKK